MVVYKLMLLSLFVLLIPRKLLLFLGRAIQLANQAAHLWLLDMMVVDHGCFRDY